MSPAAKCASFDFPVEIADVKGAYLSGNELERLVVLNQPPGGSPGSSALFKFA